MARYIILFSILSVLSLASSSLVGVSSPSAGNEEKNFRRRELNVVEFSSGDLQDVCDTLEEEIPTYSAAEPNMCNCERKDETTIELSCGIDDACLSSSGSDAMQGDYSILLKNEGVGDVQETTYAQTIEITSCFQYPSDMYDGQKVCYSTIQDGFSVNSQCTITVGDDETNKCLYCRFCAGNKLTFNCTNIGYEDKSECVDGNADGSLLQFLHEADIVDTCPKNSNQNSAANSSSASSSIFRTVVSMITGFAALYHTSWIL